MSDEIVVFGSINQDFFSYVERFPKPGESVRGLDFQLGSGGKGANQAVAIGRLGGNVSMIGMVGDDIFGEMNIKSLSKSGIKVDTIGKTKNAPTGCATITVDSKGENNVVMIPGANFELTPKRTDELTDRISSAKLILCQCEVPNESNQRAFEIANKNNVITFLNPAPMREDFDHRILGITDILCVNETETRMILKEKLETVEDFKKAAEELLHKVRHLSIITLGSAGAIVAEKKGNGVSVEYVEAPKVETVDSAGAGDCFCGALAFILLNRPDLSARDATSIAVRIASLSVTRRGCQSSYPTLHEVKSSLNVRFNTMKIHFQCL